MKLKPFPFIALFALMITSQEFAAERDEPAPSHSSSLTSYKERPRQSLSGLRHGSIDSQKFEEHVNHVMKAIRSSNLYKEALAYINESNKQEALNFWRDDIEAMLSESINEKTYRFLKYLVSPIPYNRSVAPDELNPVAEKTREEIMKLIEKDFDKVIRQN